MSMGKAHTREAGDRTKDTLERKEMSKRQETREYRDVPRDKAMEAHLKSKTERDRVLNLPRVEGFDTSGVMTDQEVRGYLKDTLPEKHANNITMDSVRYTDKTVESKEGVELGSWESEQKQTFLQPDQEITINKQSLEGDKGQEQMKDTLTHEVGHQTYSKFLSESDRKEWGKLSAERTGQECVSGYAQKDKFEDFAESYRAYVRDPESLKQVSSEKYEFMRNKVFEGREYSEI